MSELPTCRYYIRDNYGMSAGCIFGENGSPVQRVTCPNDYPEWWIIEQLPNDRYRIDARGQAPTGVRDGLLFAFLDEHMAEEWIINFQLNFQGVNNENLRQYNIEKADRTGGWVKQFRGNHPQILVRPLNRRFPYPEELWTMQQY